MNGAKIRRRASCETCKKLGGLRPEQEPGETEAGASGLGHRGTAGPDHRLIGQYAGRRESHIESHWLLGYKVQDDMTVCERTGSHSDLFSS